MQQEVRDELEDLISLLDRDEDAWVVTREVESMLEEAVELLEDTRQAGSQTVGRARGDWMSRRSEIDGSPSASGTRHGGARRKPTISVIAVAFSRRPINSVPNHSIPRLVGRSSDLSRTMEDAAEQIEQNRMANAQQAQQAAVETLENMLEDLNKNERARVEQLIRQLASLIESIERLVRVNEDELILLDGVVPSRVILVPKRSPVVPNRSSPSSGTRRASRTRRVGRGSAHNKVLIVR